MLSQISKQNGKYDNDGYTIVRNDLVLGKKLFTT